MAVKLRLKRFGRLNHPTYRVVAADARSPRDMRPMFVIDKKPVEIVRELLPTTGASTPSLYLFDEPALGLHPADQSRLATLFHRLAAAGHAVLFTDHAPGLLSTADRLLELGPGGGPEGGRWIQP